jgi:LCP family protein required for cell wall assembly
MKKRQPSIDGFMPKRLGEKLGDINPKHNQGSVFGVSNDKKFNTRGIDTTQHLKKGQSNQVVARSDIDESLRDIDSVKEPVKKLSRRQRRRIKKMAKKTQGRKVRRIVKWLAILLIVTILAVGGYMGYKFLIAGGNIFQGGILDIMQSKPLKQDNNGRSNFLILGTSEDDPGHDGASLTDSMMVVSVDQKNKNIYMFSIPRDLYVEFGKNCTSGSYGKINEYFNCVNDGTSKADEQDRLTKTQKLVGDIFGLDIQYGVHVNHTVIKEAVDSVGGVDVDVQGSEGEPGVLDRNFDWRCNYTCYLVKYDNGVHHLDGEHALYLSMARGDIAPTYGLANSNFDREVNQQKILIALKDKAMSTGTLTNLGSITSLIDSFGDNLRTNIQTSEIRTLMQVSSEVKSANIHTLTLYDKENPLVKSGGYNGASVVMPTAGIFDYTDIQAFIAKNLSNDPVVREAAPIVVLNGTGQSGYGQTMADELSKSGYNITLVETAPEGTYDSVEIYQIGKDNSATVAKLAKKYGVEVKKTAPPIAVDGSAKVVIIFGATTN